MCDFWKKAHGWAPAEAADLLASARLDRQVSFTHTLMDYTVPFAPEVCEAKQILGYTTLRSLCEGILKLLLGVYLKDYLASPKAFKDGKSGKVIAPGKLPFDKLIQFYGSIIDNDFDTYLRRIQKRGNAIHHFEDKDIGTQDELVNDIEILFDFIQSVNGRLPYPDNIYDPAAY